MHTPQIPGSDEDFPTGNAALPHGYVPATSNLRRSLFNVSFAFVLVLSACVATPAAHPATQDGLPASASEIAGEGSISSPTPSPLPSPTITLTPFPVNEDVISQAIVLEAPYLDLLEPLAELWPRQPFVTGMAFDPATGFVVLGTGYTFDPLDDGYRGAGGQTQIQFWDLRTNSARAIIETGQDRETFRSLAVSADGNRIAFVGTERILLASRDTVELSFNTREVEIPETIGKSRGAAFSPDGNLLAVIAERGDVVLLDSATGNGLSTIRVDYPEDYPGCLLYVHQVAFTADGSTLLTVCDNHLQAWNIELPESPTIAFETLIGNATTFALSPDGSYLVSGEFEGALDIFKVPSGESLAHLAGHASSVHSLAFSPDGGLLASASGESIILWDTGNWDQLAALEASANRMFFTPDGKFLISETYERGGKLWGLRGSSLTAQRSGVKVVVIPGQFDSGRWTAAIPADWLTPAGNLPFHEIQIAFRWSIVETCTYDLNGLRYDVERRQRTVIVQVSERASGEVLAEKIFEGGLPDECSDQRVFSPTAFTDTIDGASPDVDLFLPWLRGVMAELGYP